MAEVQVSVGGRSFAVACQDGAEARVRTLGEQIDSHWPAAMRAAGGINAERAMFFVALMLADKLDEALTQPAPDGTMTQPALMRLAERLERLADTLERTGPSA